MAGVLPADVVIRVLNPIVKTGSYPVNQAAIKMLTKVAEHPGNKEVIMTHLGDIMIGLIRVSKSCVISHNVTLAHSRMARQGQGEVIPLKGRYERLRKLNNKTA